MRPRDIGWVYRTSSAGMLDSPPDQSCDEVYHTRNSQREKRAPLVASAGRHRRTGQSGLRGGETTPTPVLRPDLLTAPRGLWRRTNRLNHYGSPQSFPPKRLSAQFLEWPPRRGFP